MFTAPFPYAKTRFTVTSQEKPAKELNDIKQNSKVARWQGGNFFH